MTAMTAPSGVLVPTLSNEDFVSLQRLLLDHSAIQLDQQRSYLVDARLRPVARRYHLSGVSELIRALRPDSPQMVTDIVDALTSNDTAFMLHSELVDSLVEQVLPELLAARDPSQPLTIWSAACSSGQEPYSLAILLHERYPKLVAAGQVRIVASDLSPTMVMRCAAGRYSRIEVNRGLPPEILARQFERDSRDWLVRPELRSTVEVRVINLIHAWPGIPRCDLVLARNVLPFFPEPVRNQVVDRIRRTALKPYGYLVVGPDEPALGPQSGFEPLGLSRHACYRMTERI
jgi:chemotaxis protein methyltransferase CheR